jgi:hopanoid biosynthesis associated RND transporter like protein HpnN
MSLVVAILLAAVRSARLTLAMVVTAICGLSLTSAFGLLVFGRFTLISVAFLPLCVGLGVDFAIQFCSRLRAEMKDEPPIIEALKHTSRGIGFGLALASGATCLGFLAFLPTSYRGLSELGLIAGAGMIIAFMTTISLLPALITLLGVRGGAAETGLAHFARIEKIVEGRPAQVVAVIAVLCLAAAASAPQLKFNFDPLRLRDPRTESVSTYRDLSDSPETTPATLDVMEPSLAVADREAQRLAAVPGVSRAMTLSSLVPTDQAAKLAAISDAGMLLDPTLNPFETLPPPSDAELVAALDKTGEKLKLLAAQASGDLALRAASLAKLFYAAANAAPADRARLQDALTAGLPTALDDLRNVLTAKPVSLASIPYETKLDWVTPSGAARIEVYPTLAAHGMSGDFVEAVQKVAPNVLGSSIFARELQRTILAAFAKAAIWSLLGISLLLLVALRRVRSIILALLPIAAAGLLTVGTCVLTRQDINLENIISLPLLFGVGVSFNIYFVVAWSRGARRLLSSSLARGVVFSALATGSAFSALTLSSHPGTASMGALLMIALFWILVTTLTLQPAVLILSERRGLSSASPSSRRAF